MSKVFTSEEFIKKLYWLVNDVPNYYHSQNGTFCNYNWANNKFMMDCVVSIKGLLWGFKADKNKPHGGAIYGSNGVRDFGANAGIDYCSDRSQDFRNITPGEYLCMRGTPHEHAGIYLGNGKVFECTVAWNTNKCIISDIDQYGNRSYKGVGCLKWTWHGKLQYIDYSKAPTPTPSGDKVNVYYRVKTKQNGWLDEVKNLEDYAGYKKNAIIGVAIKVDKGSVWYQAHIKGKGWLGRVTGYDLNDYYNGYAGDDRNIIDCIRVYYNTPSDIIKSSGYKKAKYRVNNLPWVYDNEKDANGEDYAGNMGENAYKFEITIE